MSRVLVLGAVLLIAPGCDESNQRNLGADRAPGLVDSASLEGGGAAADATRDSKGDSKGGPVEARLPDRPPGCGPQGYPCGPYGTAVGDIAADQSWNGYADPGYLCPQSHADEKLDTTKLVPLAFHNWWGAPCRPKLLWVMISAGWCTPCKNEETAVAKLYSTGGIDRRVGFVNLIYETNTVGVPATDTFVKDWAAALGLTFPVGADPTKKLLTAGYYGSGIPFNLLLDLSSMKILFKENGGSEQGVLPKIQAFLTANP